jgi:hypothetical protein
VDLLDKHSDYDGIKVCTTAAIAWAPTQKTEHKRGNIVCAATEDNVAHSHLMASKQQLQRSSQLELSACIRETWA